MDTSYFAGEITGGLEDACYPDGRNPHGRERTIYFDSAPIHNTKTVMGQLEQSGLKRMEHSPSRPDLAPSNFFLFCYMKEQLKGRSFLEEEELLSVLSELMSEVPPDMILQVFVDWNRWLWRCLLTERKCAEKSFKLNWFLTSGGKRTRRVRALNAHHVISEFSLNHDQNLFQMTATSMVIEELDILCFARIPFDGW
jgi:hypothetical protein